MHARSFPKMIGQGEGEGEGEAGLTSRYVSSQFLALELLNVFRNATTDSPWLLELDFPDCSINGTTTILIFLW